MSFAQTHKIQDKNYHGKSQRQQDVEELHVRRDKYHQAVERLEVAEQDMHSIKQLLKHSLHDDTVADLGRCIDFTLLSARIRSWLAGNTCFTLPAPKLVWQIVF